MGTKGIEMSQSEKKQDEHQPASEIFVLHGRISNHEHLEWVLRTGLYNFRIPNVQGSLILKPSVENASYIYFHGSENFMNKGQLFEVVSKSPRVFSDDHLFELDFPDTAFELFYLVYKVKSLHKDHPLAQYDWDLPKTISDKEIRAYTFPKEGIPLNIFMKGALTKECPKNRHVTF
ncbi:hypothetical protein P0Y35_18670 [Kiritimatiellaeota bacterium B1221]|nr:hypothetical protein [Kiritimatiellaeota bacterium B1221]